VENPGTWITWEPGKEIIIKRRHAKRLNILPTARLNKVHANGLLSVHVTMIGKNKGEANWVFEPSEVELCDTLT
jgi:hypothetical protein